MKEKNIDILALIVAYPTTNGGTQIVRPVRTRIAHTFLHAQSGLSNKISASDLGRKFIKSALLVGHEEKEKKEKKTKEKEMWKKKKKTILFEESYGKMGCLHFECMKFSLSSSSILFCLILISVSEREMERER